MQVRNSGREDGCLGLICGIPLILLATVLILEQASPDNGTACKRRGPIHRSRCVCLPRLLDSKQVCKLNVRNQGRLTHHRKREQNPDSQLMPIITAIKACKWLHPTLSLTALAVPSLLLPTVTFVMPEKTASRCEFSYRTARWGSLAPLFAPVKGKCQRKIHDDPSHLCKASLIY